VTVTDRLVRLRGLGAAAIIAGLAACGTSGTSNTSSGAAALKTGPGIDTATKTIHLGVLTPLSGPVAVIGKPLTLGQETFFQQLNDSGGIEGWKIDIKDHEKDTKYDPQTQVQQYNAVIDSVAFIAQSLGSPTTLAIQQLADQGKVLIGAATQSSSWVTDPVMAVIGNPYSIDIANGIDWVVNKLGKKSAKIAIVYQNDEYGQDGLRGYKAALDTYHFNDVGQLTYAATDTSFTSQIQALATAGAEYVFLVATPSPAGKLVGTGAALKYLPNWVFQGPCWSGLLMTSDGSATGKPTPLNNPAITSHISVLGFQAQWGDTSVPGMTKFLADHDKYAPTQVPDPYYMYGYAEAEMEAAVLKKAIDSNDLSRQGILTAKLNTGKITFGGLTPDVNYTPQLGPVAEQTEVAQVDITIAGFLKVVQPYFLGDAAKTLKFPAS
jgi:ABC-type branched-subunit amino acid transport system substrate-binding protein